LLNGVWQKGLDSIIGVPQTNRLLPWSLKKIEFNQFAGEIIKIRFRKENGSGFNKIAIDDVEFYSPSNARC
jgi:hypothetical protein|tara:strand:- start:355 stop:567 length:213 start_codon:yes stop_codon:yes gene_type:complete